MVFQKPVLLRRTVAANITFALGAAGRPRADLPVLLDRAGLSEKAAQPARTLSGGEQQRLALVRALAVRPQILFLDEPTASLDPAATLLIETILRDVSADGAKVIMVTHDIAQARRLAGDIVFCHGGRVAETGPAHRVLREPGTEEAGDFLAGRLRA